MVSRMTMDELKAAIRRDHKPWAFLTEVIDEHRFNRPTFGVTGAGSVLVNPSFVEALGVSKMVKLIRNELKVANDLRKAVRFME